MLLALALLLLPVAHARTRVDLVLSHYAEPLHEVALFVEQARSALLHSTPEEGGAELQRVFLVTHDHTVERSSENNWTVMQVPGGNYGRESSAYLYWIEVHGREIGLDKVWFSHALPDKYMEKTLWPRLKRLRRRTGMLGLAIMGRTSCKGGVDVALGPFLGAIHFAHTGKFCRPSTRWSVMNNAEFVVSTKRLRLLHRHLAQQLRQQLAAPDNDEIHVTPGWQTPTLFPQNSNRVSSVLGYAVERTWNLFFDCTGIGGGGASWGQPCDEGGPCAENAAQCLDEME